jgi:ribosomal protein S18 acetylase RimI-like enzyme
MALEIRVFQPDDHAQAWRLWSSTEGVLLSEADTFQSVCRFLARNQGLSFVASDGGEIVATILCGHDGRRGLIHHLAVVGTHRRRGLGGALVARAVTGLREEGICRCYLFVLRENLSGGAFWRNLGAEERENLVPLSLLIGSPER